MKGHGESIRDLLRPLGLYRWDGSIQEREWTAIGRALDDCASQLEEIQREMCLSSAQTYGLSQYYPLLHRIPPAKEQKEMQQALAALFRIGDNSFTTAAIRDNLRGCGLLADVQETETPGKVTISFPGVPGIPPDFPQIVRILDTILPSHLEVEYLFWYVTFWLLESKFLTWKALEEKVKSWDELERQVQN